MKKLTSYFLVLLLLMTCVIPVKGVHASTSDLTGKVLTWNYDDASSSITTSEEMIVIGIGKEEGKYYQPTILKGTEGATIYFRKLEEVTYSDGEKGYNMTDDWLSIKGVSTLDELKSYVSNNVESLEKTDTTMTYDVLKEKMDSFAFFTKSGGYLGTSSLNDLETKLQATVEDAQKQYGGGITVKVEPLEKESANVVVSYDFSNYPESLGGEYMKTFSIFNNNDLEDKDKDSAIITEDQSIDQMEDIDDVVGTVPAINIKKNGTYTVTAKTNIGTYTKEFTVSRSISRGCSLFFLRKQ